MTQEAMDAGYAEGYEHAMSKAVRRIAELESDAAQVRTALDLLAKRLWFVGNADALVSQAINRLDEGQAWYKRWYDSNAEAEALRSQRDQARAEAAEYKIMAKHHKEAVAELEAALAEKDKALAEARERLAAAERQKNAAYSERNKLVAALSKLFPASLERHPAEDKTWEDDWRWVVYIDITAGQASWHLHDSELHQFDHLPRKQGRKWDGHTTEEKYRRLELLPLARLAALDGEGAKRERNWDCDDGYIDCQVKGKHKHEASGPCQSAQKGGEG